MNRRIFSSLAVGALLLLAAPLARADEPLPPLPASEATTTPAPPPVCVRVLPDGTNEPIACPRVTPPPREPETEMESRWYGWQILIVDGASIVTMPILVGVGGYFLGGPIVHAAHDHWGMGALSLGLRVAGPTVGILAMGGADCKGDFCGLGLLLGAAVGAGVAIAIDVALLAHDEVPVTKAPERAAAPIFSIKPSVTPELTPRRELHGVSLGVSGTF